MIEPLPSPGCSLPEAPLYGVLQLPGLSLFVPQREVDGVEQWRPAAQAGNGALRLGVQHIDELDYAIYRLDRHLQLLPAPGVAMTCVLLGNDQQRLGLLCEQYDSAAREQIQLRCVPSQLQRPGSPVTAFAIAGGRLGYVTDTTALCRRIEQLVRERNTSLQRNCSPM